MIRLWSVGLVLLALACGSSGSAPDAGDAGTTDARAGDLSNALPSACGDRVSEADCQRCGVPSMACSAGGPPAPACTTPPLPADQYACCYAGTGRYCACVTDRWVVVVCDPPSRDAGRDAPEDAAPGQ